ncbi:PREDICTED: protein Wnt-4a-like [Priapulus caudatus]|uniref:Protein Wnt n=1 Tax=Priapulus caudatus TaxID=37621 RepID=A0A3P3ZKQ7_PRICU|nr:PREDICTED: protein Wnt-4a-like [Priapulus caudatus]VAY10407.1 WntA [Priapulus caudatus]
MAAIRARWITSVILLSVFCHTGLSSYWWFLGTSSVYQSTVDLKTYNFKEKCQQLNYLIQKQKDLCGISHNILAAVSKGAAMGIDECKYQFQTRRWNCTTFNETSVFGGVLNINSREKSYIYAISSGGVEHEITKACAKGDINECGCDDSVRSLPTKDKWEWGGCSQDIRYGEKFSKEFTDSKENSRARDGMMNLHNNEAGRRSIRSTMKIVCKCHGVSGSCSIKVCWRKMSDFRRIGSMLKQRFDGATLVDLNKRRTRLRPKTKGQKQPTKKDLVYLEESPDFCEYDPTIGSLGTRHRECNRTSYGIDGCRLMCCGRGYHTMVEQVTEDCDCKFFWCCEVRCRKCTQMVDKNYCN